MPRPANIPVSVEPTVSTPEQWGNSLPILHEIRHGLRRLADTGERSRIDLSALPFGPSDEERLLAMLGEGEVEAQINALGTTRIWESAIQGVWIIDHRNLQEQRLALHIEITEIPDILCTQPQDIEDAITALDHRIAAGPLETDIRGEAD